jgi:hypothetical protein
LVVLKVMVLGYQPEEDLVRLDLVMVKGWMELGYRLVVVCLGCSRFAR